MKEIPIWKQYGFDSEVAFRKKYPRAGTPQSKGNTRKQRRDPRLGKQNTSNRGVL